MSVHGFLLSLTITGSQRYIVNIDVSTPDEDLQLVAHLFDAFATGDIDAVIGLISDDFVLVVPPSMSAEPDTYEGPAGARRYMDAFEGVVDDVRFRAEELHAEGGCVIARVQVTGRGAASGIEVQMWSASIIRVQNGKVTGIEAHADLATAREALTGR
jgi:ketosteroid isomerase-like protein